MSYVDTFIQVAADCPVDRGVVPVARGEGTPIHVLQYELLANHPYAYTHENLLWEVHVRHRQVSPDDLRARGGEIRAALFERKHPCLRASLLPKKYGWGVHYDARGGIALHARESPEYQRFTGAASDGPTLLAAMRNRRA